MHVSAVEWLYTCCHLKGYYSKYCVHITQLYEVYTYLIFADVATSYGIIFITQVAGKVISVFSHQLFVTGFVHSDPHPGNMFVRSSPRGGAEVVLLDHGLYMHVEEK